MSWFQFCWKRSLAYPSFLNGQSLLAWASLHVSPLALLMLSFHCSSRAFTSRSESSCIKPINFEDLLCFDARDSLCWLLAERFMRDRASARTISPADDSVSFLAFSLSLRVFTGAACSSRWLFSSSSSSSRYSFFFYNLEIDLMLGRASAKMSNL